MRPTACPTCDVKAVAVVGEQDLAGFGRLRLVRCEGCGVAFLDPQPEPADLEPFYSRDYYGPGGTKFAAPVSFLRSRFARARARRLSRGLPPRSRVLDVGCGEGILLAGFAALGHEGTGIERMGTRPNPEPTPAQVVIHRGSPTTGGFPASHFDLCVYWHSLEHMPDPLAALQEAHRVLRPGGRLVVAVPNIESLQAKWAGFDWFHLDLPRHLFHFTPRSLAALLSRAGFSVQRIGHHALEQNPFGVLQSALNVWAGPQGRTNALYEILKSGSDAAPMGRQIAQRLAFALGMPLAVLFAVIESLLGRGGTIEAWALRGEDRA